MEKKPIVNMVIVEGEITKIFEKRSEKAPTNFTVKAVECYSVKNNGIEEEKKRTTYVKCRAFNFPTELVEGDVVHMIGGVRTDSYEKDGKKIYNQELFFNKIEKIGHNEHEEENIPEDIPEGDIDLSEIPF